MSTFDWLILTAVALFCFWQIRYIWRFLRPGGIIAIASSLHHQIDRIHDDLEALNRAPETQDVTRSATDRSAATVAGLDQIVMDVRQARADLTRIGQQEPRFLRDRIYKECSAYLAKLEADVDEAITSHTKGDQ